MIDSVGYEYKRFHSISSNHVRHGKCLVKPGSLPIQAWHKHWLKYLSQSTHQKAARVDPAPTNHRLIQQPSIFRDSTSYSRLASKQHHAVSEKKGNHKIGTEAHYNPLNPPNQALTIERKKKPTKPRDSIPKLKGKKRGGIK